MPCSKESLIFRDLLLEIIMTELCVYCGISRICNIRNKKPKEEDVSWMRECPCQECIVLAACKAMCKKRNKFYIKYQGLRRHWETHP
jgi:hypothetical protein